MFYQDSANSKVVQFMQNELHLLCTELNGRV